MSIRRISQKMVVHGTGLGQSQISGYMNGVDPPATNIVKIAEFFGITADLLIRKPIDVANAPSVCEEGCASCQQLRDKIAALEYHVSVLLKVIDSKV